MTERKKMAQWWADHLDTLRSGETAEIITLGRRSAQTSK
jgi:hypothetical protein